MKTYRSYVYQFEDQYSAVCFKQIKLHNSWVGRCQIGNRKYKVVGEKWRVIEWCKSMAKWGEAVNFKLKYSHTKV